MRRPTLLVLVSVLLFSLPGSSQTPAPAPSPAAREASTNRLPVKKVVLYKNGVGYFEHTTRVRGTQDLNIDFTTGQLNDVLKSLTVLDLGEGHIASVRYNSVAPLAERLRTLRLPLGEQPTQQEFLNALRGTRLSAQSGARAALGRLLSVETKTKRGAKGEAAAEVTEIALVSDSGEVNTFELGPGTTVRIAERDLNEEVGQYMNLLASARSQDVRRMTITAAGDKDREVFVSYISEVPVWKSTYRLIMPDKPGEKPLLQGWAIVDNTIGEDWKDVHLSLVAGAPQSFVQQISQPFYVRRPVVEMPESMTLTPQTHEAGMVGVGEGRGSGGGAFSQSVGGTASLEGTVDDPSGAVVPGARVTFRNSASGFSQTTATDSAGKFMFTGLPRGESTLTTVSPGFKTSVEDVDISAGRRNEIDVTLDLGSTTETVMLKAAPAPPPPPRAVLAEALRRQRPEAEGKELGDQFEYKITGPITLGKNQSALVPILQSALTAEKVTLWNSSERQTLRALWLTNTTGLTLDGGTFNVIDAEAFAGEGLIEILHPGEKRFISYAADLAVKVDSKTESSLKPITKVRINKGVVITTKEERAKTTYTIRNADPSPRQVIIEHPARDEWELVGSAKPEETTTSFHRFRVMVEPGKTAELVVEERRPVESRIRLASTTRGNIALLLEQTKTPPAVEQALRGVIAGKDAVSGLDRQMGLLQQELDSLGADQVRVRENMKALKGSAEEKTLLQRYVHQLDTQEDRIVALRAEIAGIKEKREAAQAELDKTISELALDVTL